jgi:hypothetical protein
MHQKNKTKTTNLYLFNYLTTTVPARVPIPHIHIFVVPLIEKFLPETYRYLLSGTVPYRYRRIWKINLFKKIPLHTFHGRAPDLGEVPNGSEQGRNHHRVLIAPSQFGNQHLAKHNKYLYKHL